MSRFWKTKSLIQRKKDTRKNFITKKRYFFTQTFYLRIPKWKTGLEEIVPHKSRENNSINYQGYLDPHKR